MAEGLTLALGFGTAFPFGKYNVGDATVQGITIGNNIWVFVPTAFRATAAAPRCSRWGPVVAYDIPEYAAFVKLKALASEINNNMVRSWGVALTFAKKL